MVEGGGGSVSCVSVTEVGGTVAVAWLLELAMLTRVGGTVITVVKIGCL